MDMHSGTFNPQDFAWQGLTLTPAAAIHILAGWNTMRKENKATYNVQAICQLYGKCVMGCGLGLFLLLYGSFSGQNPPLLVGLGLFMAMVVLSILLPILNPKRYRK